MDSTENWDIESALTNNDEAQESENVQPLPVVPGYSNFDDYLTEAFDVIRAGIKAANNLPNGENYRYYSCFSSFNNAKNENVKRVLRTMQGIMNVARVSGSIVKRDIDEKFDLLLEANDVFLDQANVCMDEESGIARNPEVEVVSQVRRENVNGSWNLMGHGSDHVKSNAADNSQAIRLLAAKNVQRPQLLFKDEIDNSSTPWQPRLKEKPNSLKPLSIYLEVGENGEVFNHPYEFELDKFEPPDHQLEKSPTVKYKSLEETPLIIIERPQDIKILLDDLKNYSEIAVDLEHHSYRSFQGITCLMQISTRDTDYVIDTLSLRSKLHELNEIFTKPSIQKVFHGANSDILWLQRDLSLYVVNMFDTHQAAKQLNLPYLSLAYLLKRYCGIDPNKHFQLADWRIRPLPEELKKYAREDTHYLLYIKDILKNALIDTANGQTNILKAVYNNSTEICKTTYVKPVWSEDSYMNMYRKSQKMFNNKQLYALKEMHKWRDTTARQEDDSIGYVLPNHMLLNIAEALPREMQGILACCNPIPPLVRQNLLRLHKIILTAREQPLIKPVLEEDLRQRLTQRNQYANSDAWIYAPHDIPSGTEPRADLPCLLDCNNSQEATPLIATMEHVVTVFDSPTVSEDEEATVETAVKSKKKFHFISPFERYKRVIPMIAEQEAEQREKQKQEQMEKQNVKKEAEENESNICERLEDSTIGTSDESTMKLKGQKKPQVPLGQMPGRKKKRDSGIRAQKESTEKRESNLTTPIPSLSTKIVQGSKRKSDEVEDLREEKEIKRNLEEVQAVHDKAETFKPLRDRIKGDRKATNKDLLKKGMLPTDSFNYKAVDFSSFQGGSMNNPSVNQSTFQQRSQKKKNRGRKRKKQKII